MRRVKKILKRAIIIFYDGYYIARTWWPVWFYFLNYEGRSLYRKGAHPPTPLQQRIIRDLKNDGIARTSLEELFPGRDILSTLERYCQEALPHGEILDGKPFLKKLMDEKQINFGSPFIALALERAVLEIVAGYMDMYVKFFGYSLNQTLPIAAGVKPIRSQMWHRDPTDLKMCKMFVYVNDVGMESGPFTYIPKTHYGGSKYHFFNDRIPLRRARIPDEVLADTFKEEEIKICMGRRGTVIFADTMGIHKGGYATAQSRFMFTAEYCAKAALTSILYSYPQNFQSAYGQLGICGKFAVRNAYGFLRVINSIMPFSVTNHLY